MGRRKKGKYFRRTNTNVKRFSALFGASGGEVKSNKGSARIHVIYSDWMNFTQSLFKVKILPARCPSQLHSHCIDCLSISGERYSANYKHVNAWVMSAINQSKFRSSDDTLQLTLHIDTLDDRTIIIFISRNRLAAKVTRTRQNIDVRFLTNLHNSAEAVIRIDICL